jgi:uncharacterized membrane protein (UPF0127 family)
MIINLTRKKYLARSPFYANGYILRMRGMLGRDFATSDFDAMVFSNCNSIHTMFMQCSLDVIFVRRDNVVCRVCKNLPPWKLLVRSAEAFTTIELPCGIIAATDTQIGDVLDMSAELSAETEREMKGEKIITVAETVIPCKANKE